MQRLTSRSQGRRALTLIETMVAMTITMILVLAMAQAFQSISTTIAHNRATIEMAGQLRGAATQLEQDLAGITVPLMPWAEMSGPGGYFEIYEGPDKDYFTSDVDTSLGDVDDVLMFTSRNSVEPYTGFVNGTAITSSDAEIVWFIASNDFNGDGVIEANERFLYRKVLLVRPELAATSQFSDPGFPGTDDLTQWPNRYPNNAMGWASLMAHLQDFYNNNDVSVRLRWGVGAGNLIVSLVPNSLADLSARQNRFAHYPILIDNPSVRLVTPGDFQATTPNATFPIFPYALDVNQDSVTSIGRLLNFGGRIGEDVILPNAIAFDVRVFDPTAEVRVHPGADGDWGVSGYDDNGSNGADDIAERGWANSDDELVTPGDPGFDAVSATAVVGAGAYVDLDYFRSYNYASSANTSAVRSIFSGTSQLRSGLSGLANNSFGQPLLATYDTWSLFYEHDGVNQDASAGSTPPPPSTALPLFPPALTDGTDNLIDEGANGFDDDGQNGVDDPGERETSPPYPIPLRGIEVRLRTMEYDTRLVAQSTVVMEFVPD